MQRVDDFLAGFKEQCSQKLCARTHKRGLVMLNEFVFYKDDEAQGTWSYDAFIAEKVLPNATARRLPAGFPTRSALYALVYLSDTRGVAGVQELFVRLSRLLLETTDVIRLSMHLVVLKFALLSLLRELFGAIEAAPGPAEKLLLAIEAMTHATIKNAYQAVRAAVLLEPSSAGGAILAELWAAVSRPRYRFSDELPFYRAGSRFAAFPQISAEQEPEPEPDDTPLPRLEGSPSMFSLSPLLKAQEQAAAVPPLELEPAAALSEPEEGVRGLLAAPAIEPETTLIELGDVGVKRGAGAQQRLDDVAAQMFLFSTAAEVRPVPAWEYAKYLGRLFQKGGEDMSRVQLTNYLRWIEDRYLAGDFPTKHPLTLQARASQVARFYADMLPYMALGGEPVEPGKPAIVFKAAFRTHAVLAPTEDEHAMHAALLAAFFSHLVHTIPRPSRRPRSNELEPHAFHLILDQALLLRHALRRIAEHAEEYALPAYFAALTRRGSTAFSDLFLPHMRATVSLEAPFVVKLHDLVERMDEDARAGFFSRHGVYLEYIHACTYFFVHVLKYLLGNTGIKKRGELVGKYIPVPTFSLNEPVPSLTPLIVPDDAYTVFRLNTHDALLQFLTGEAAPPRPPPSVTQVMADVDPVFFEDPEPALPRQQMHADDIAADAPPPLIDDTAIALSAAGADTPPAAPPAEEGGTGGRRPPVKPPAVVEVIARLFEETFPGASGAQLRALAIDAPSIAAEIGVAAAAAPYMFDTQQDMDPALAAYWGVALAPLGTGKERERVPDYLVPFYQTRSMQAYIAAVEGDSGFAQATRADRTGVF
jgi:hypothetical protein